MTSGVRIYREGEWSWLAPGLQPEAEEDVGAVVRYSDEPCAETGCVGWCWWAAGKFGDAKTQAEAEEKAELSLRKRGYL